MFRTTCMLSLSLVLISSCTPLRSPKQESENSAAPSTTTIDGAELTLASTLRRRDTGKHQFDLAGELAVSVAPGLQLPPNLEIGQFTLRASKPGFFVQPFARRQNGEWTYRGMTTSSDYEPKFTVRAQRNVSSIVIGFDWREIGGGWTDNPSNYDAVDVTVRVTDSRGKHHILSNLAVPAAH